MTRRKGWVKWCTTTPSRLLPLVDSWGRPSAGNPPAWDEQATLHGTGEATRMAHMASKRGRPRIDVKAYFALRLVDTQTMIPYISLSIQIHICDTRFRLHPRNLMQAR
jgi:hypothetical protein